jgi:hypothetical protein
MYSSDQLVIVMNTRTRVRRCTAQLVTGHRSTDIAIATGKAATGATFTRRERLADFLNRSVAIISVVIAAIDIRITKPSLTRFTDVELRLGSCVVHRAGLGFDGVAHLANERSRLGDRLVAQTDAFLELASSMLIARAYNREMIVFVFRDLLLFLAARAVLDSRQLLRLVAAAFAFLGIAIEMQPFTARERGHDRYAAKTALVTVASAQERSALAMFADDTVGGEG